MSTGETLPAFPTPPSTDAGGGRSVFATTHWSVVLAAGHSHTPRARAALESLCRAYWHPLYAYVRRRGHAPADAQDLTQEFFARLLERKAMTTVDPVKGKFRSFLLASMNHFLADEWDKARAQKRGRDKTIAVDWQEAETRLESSLPAELTPEKAFERKWAITLLEEVYRKLAAEHQQSGKAKLFEVLRATLAGAGNSAPYADLARQLDTSEGAVKVMVHRLRHRYRELLRETIADTVADPAEVEEELRYLVRTLGGV